MKMSLRCLNKISKKVIAMKRLTAFCLMIMFSVPSFAGDKRITCPEFSDKENFEGHLEGGAWRTTVFEFNTDDFSREGERFASVSRRVHYTGEWKKKMRTNALDWSTRTQYLTTPNSIIFQISSDQIPYMGDAEIDRTSLVYRNPGIGGEKNIQCSISDLQVERAF